MTFLAANVMKFSKQPFFIMVDNYYLLFIIYYLLLDIEKKGVTNSYLNFSYFENN